MKRTSFKDITTATGGISAQVRKDLAGFGEFGIRGVGYHVEKLNENIKSILGINHSWKMVIIGAGNLRMDLARYSRFKKRGFLIMGVFDKDPNKVSSKSFFVPVLAMNCLETFIELNDRSIAIIATPADLAQEVGDALAGTMVKSFLNFSLT